MVKGNVGKIIFAHDTVRVIECLVAQGDETIRNALFDEMKDEVISMAKSKFASFFVQKLVKYGTKGQLISECPFGPKYQRKIWQIFALESEKWSSQQNNGTFI